MRVKIVKGVLLPLLFLISACSQTEAKPSEIGVSDVESRESNENKMNTNYEELIPITLTIDDVILEGYLNDSIPAQSLKEQLPLTVELNDSDNDFCGGNIDIAYTDNDVQNGYKNGDIAFWIPANNFVIFVSDEETSINTDDIVNLGHITSSLEMLDKLDGQIEVTIELKEENIQHETTVERNGDEQVEVRITFDDTELFATFENNSTAQAIIEQMPMELPMLDLYNREMCYRFDAYALPTDELRNDAYEVGDIVYWPPRGSFVILYGQNGEQFERQQVGHIESGIEQFKNAGDTTVTFEVVSE